jgi:hypothetical protein
MPEPRPRRGFTDPLIGFPLAKEPLDAVSETLRLAPADRWRRQPLLRTCFDGGGTRWRWDKLIEQQC